MNTHTHILVTVYISFSILYILYIIYFILSFHSSFSSLSLKVFNFGFYTTLYLLSGIFSWFVNKILFSSTWLYIELSFSNYFSQSLKYILNLYIIFHYGFEIFWKFASNLYMKYFSNFHTMFVSNLFIVPLCH